MIPPVAATGMLIRRPVGEVFQAFVDPAVTARFWFTHGSRSLTEGANVTWTWAMYGHATEVQVQAIDPDRRILLTWDNTADPTEVEWRFEPRGNHTFVTVENRGFTGTPDEQVAKALDSVGGFNLVLAGAKIWLEHAIEPGFVQDRHPDHLAPGWNPAA